MESSDVRSEGDVFSALGWGVRRYAWFVLAAMAILGISIPLVLQHNAVDQFDAQAQVGPITALELPNLDALPRSGETVFSNGTVAAAVRQELGLDNADPVIPERVELVAPQDNVVFTVIGHGTNAQDAVNAANTAAGKLTEELNKYEKPVGTFAVQSSATEARPLASAPTLPLVMAGQLAGLLVGVGLVAVLLVWRRPVLGPAHAERAAGAPVLATLRMGSPEDEVRGLPQLCHRLLHSKVSAVYLTGPEPGRQHRQRLAMELRSVLAGSGPLRQQESATQIVEAPTQKELAVRPVDSLTLLVVPVGTWDSSLRREAELYLDPGTTGIVLVRKDHRSEKPLARLLGRRDATAALKGGRSPRKLQRLGSNDSAMTSQ